MPTAAEDVWNEFLRWYLEEFGVYDLSPVDEMSVEEISEAASKLLAIRIANSMSADLDSLGFEGQLLYDDEMTWIEKTVAVPALVSELRTSIFHWLGDNYPDEANAVLTTGALWASEFIFNTFEVPAANKKVWQKGIMMYLGLKMPDILSIDETQDREDILNDIDQKLLELETKIDSYEPLFAKFFSKLENELADLENASYVIIKAINYGIGNLEELGINNHAEVMGALENLQVSIDKNTNLLMFGITIQLDAAAEGMSLPPELVLLREQIELAATSENPNRVDEFVHKAKLFHELLAARKQGMAAERQKKAEDRAKTRLSLSETVAIFDLIFTLANSIKDPYLRRNVKIIAVFARNLIVFTANIASLGPLGIVTGLVTLAFNLISSLVGTQKIDPLQQVFENLSDLIMEVYEKLDQRILDLVALNRFNHAEVMSELRNMQMTLSSISNTLDNLQMGQQDILSAINTLAMGIIRQNYTSLAVSAKFAASEYFDPAVDTTTAETLGTFARDWMTLAATIPTHSNVSFPASQSATNRERLFRFREHNHSPEMLLNIFEQDMSLQTDHQQLSALHLNPKYLSEILPSLEIYLDTIRSVHTFSEIAYRNELNKIYKGCQNAIGLALCAKANVNMFRILFNKLHRLIGRYEVAVEKMFWDNDAGDSGFQIQLNNKYEEFQVRMINVLGDQIVSPSGAHLTFGYDIPRGLKRKDFGQDPLARTWTDSWLTLDKSGLILDLGSDRHVWFEDWQNNSETLQYFGGIQGEEDGNNMSYSYSDLETLEQWKIVLHGPESLGINYHFPFDPFRAGTVFFSRRSPPEHDEQELKDLIKDRIAFHLNDVHRLKSSGKLDVNEILSRALHGLVVEEDREYFAGLYGNPGIFGGGGYDITSSELSFAVHPLIDIRRHNYWYFGASYKVFGVPKIDQYFELRGNYLDIQDNHLGVEIEEMFKARYERIAQNVRDGAFVIDSDADGEILTELSATVSKLKAYLQFAFHDLDTTSYIVKWLDEIEANLTDFNHPAFGAFNPLDLVGSGFSPIKTIRNEVNKLASLVDFQSLSFRKRLILGYPIAENFGNCRDLMVTIDRIIDEHFSDSIRLDEIANAGFNASIEAVLDATLIPPEFTNFIFDDDDSITLPESQIEREEVVELLLQAIRSGIVPKVEPAGRLAFDNMTQNLLNPRDVDGPMEESYELLGRHLKLNPDDIESLIKLGLRN